VAELKQAFFEFVFSEPEITLAMITLSLLLVSMINRRFVISDRMNFLCYKFCSIFMVIQTQRMEPFKFHSSTCLKWTISNDCYPLSPTRIRVIVGNCIMLSSTVIPEGDRVLLPVKTNLVLRNMSLAKQVLK
jgi:hypothetical protein